MADIDQTKPEDTSPDEGKNSAGNAGKTTAETKTDGQETAKSFTQTDVDLIVAKRLDEEKSRQRKREEDAQKRSDEERAKAQGEWQTLAEAREAEVKRLEGELTKRDDYAVRAKVAARHKLPEHYIARLSGSSEEEYDADAKLIAKDLAPPKASDTEGGERSNGTRIVTAEAARKEQQSTGRYDRY